MSRRQEGLACKLGRHREPSARVIRYDHSEDLRLEEMLQLADLQALEEAFANHSLMEGEDGQESSGKHLRKGPAAARQLQQPGNLTLPEFRALLSELFGSETWNSQMEVLFNKVDTSCDGFVDWGEFCTFMLLQYKERDYMKTRKKTFLTHQPIIRLCLQNKQEPTSRIVAIASPPPLWFVTVSKGGVLTTWDSDLNMQKCYEIEADVSNLQAGKRRFKSWTTDAVYMPNVHKIAVTTTSRDIHFFDVSTMNMFEEFHLFALNNIPTALHYWYDTKAPGKGSLVIWGDDHGGLHLLCFQRPHSGLFEKPFTHQPGPQKVYMQDLKEHSRLVSYEAIPDVHPEAVTKVMYVPERELLITSSSSARVTVAIMDISRKKNAYTWRINKGVRCFDYCGSLNLLVTGGMDHRVCMWNQYVTSRPVAVFQEHHTAILDVVVYEPKRQIFSFSNDSVLKVWDISAHTCLQTLVLRFPCVHPGRVLEHGDFPFLLVPEPLNVLLVSYSDYVGMLRLGKGALADEIFTTHDAPLCGALYNSFFHQVVTGSEDSTITVWDIETGSKYLLLNNAHGKDEITCMAFDNSQRKLITGARNGTAKVWNIQNGHNLHKLEAVEEAEITAVIVLRESTLLTVGWSQKIVAYNISQTENLHLVADRSWKGGHLHKEDILTADYCPSLGLLATASFDGEIIVWKTETQRLYLYLRKAHPNRPHFPVDKLLFLQHRCSDRALKEAAILVSAEAGTLCWWRVFADQHMSVSFYAPHRADESVLGMSCSADSTVLVTGDTSGWIRIWDISAYGMHFTDQGSERRPPLLCDWRAHDSTVVSVQYLLFSSDAFVLSSSVDKTARLWTSDGRCVGTFGQEKSWNLKNPATFLCPKSPLGDRTTDKEKAPLETHAFKTMEHSGGIMNTENTTEPEIKATRDQSSPVQLCGYESTTNEDGEPDVEPALPTCQRHLAQCKRRTISGQRMEEDLVTRTLARKERRGVFTDINLNKLYRHGKLCSPFQALATVDVENFTLPEGLPMSSWMLSQGMACSTESDLGTLRLTVINTELEN